MDVLDASDSRLALLRQWVTEDLGFAGSHIEPASADASFRRYFRLSRGGDSYIVMDAPPEKEAVAPFIGVARSLLGIGLNVPVILARDPERGLLLLSDLGKRQYLSDLLAGREVERLYVDALDALVRLQTRGDEAAHALPPYDRAALIREMELFPEWFLGRHLRFQPTSAERVMLDRLFETLAQSALTQPAVFVHRDYHSRNLLVTDEANPGILDFQDAVRGAATYDVVSLLKDCYIAWPRERVIGWLLKFREKLRRAGLELGVDDKELIRQFDLMGLQRHIKVLGIFARLFYRDGKAGYLEDLPRVLAYTREAAALYPETAEFARYIEERIDPCFEAAQARACSQAAGAGSAAAAPAGAAPSSAASSSAASSSAAQSSHPPSR
jgi:aminoglycoside/choline kinase family phosphotransferase